MGQMGFLVGKESYFTGRHLGEQVPASNRGDETIKGGDRAVPRPGEGAKVVFQRPVAVKRAAPAF